MINAQSKVEEMIWSLLVLSWCISWEEGDYCCLPCIVIFKYHAECLWPDIHFICSLPWQGLKAGTKKHKYERISEKKVSTSIEVDTVIIGLLESIFCTISWTILITCWLFQALCRGYPTEFASYFHYCRSLRFDDRPDYAYLKRIFCDLFIREGVKLIWHRVHLFCLCP